MRGGRLLLLVAAFLLVGATKEELRSSLATVEGEVVAIGQQLGEGELELLTVTLDDAEGEEVALLLAPKATLDELGFEIAEGDQIKAKVFPAAEGPLKVHKVKNLTHNTMLRLRTLHETPLWNGSGAWQGGPGQGRMGGWGHGRRRGQEGRGPGR